VHIIPPIISVQSTVSGFTSSIAARTMRAPQEPLIRIVWTFVMMRRIITGLIMRILVNAYPSALSPDYPLAHLCQMFLPRLITRTYLEQIILIDHQMLTRFTHQLPVFDLCPLKRSLSITCHSRAHIVLPAAHPMQSFIPSAKPHAPSRTAHSSRHHHPWLCLHCQLSVSPHRPSSSHSFIR